MKALRISLAVVALSALTVFCASVLASKPVRPATSARTLPKGALSAHQTVSALALPESRDGGPTLTRSPLDRCLGVVSPEPPDAPPPPPSVPDPRLFKRDYTIQTEGNVVRFLPTIPESDADRPDRPNGALDEGSDGCPGTVIVSLPYTDQGTLRGKHADFPNPNCFSQVTADVIYKIIPAHTTIHTFTLNASSPAALSLRRDGGCPGATTVECSSNYYTGRVAQFGIALTAGETYYVVVDGDTAQGGGAYTFEVREVLECTPDLEITAPASATGNTCFAGNDCPLADGQDQFVLVHLPQDGDWKFSLCDAQRWYARLMLSTSCCMATPLAESYYGCPYIFPDYAERPSIGPISLTAGNYYVMVDAEGEYCGSWTLTVELDAPACSTPPNDLCENAGAPAQLPVTFTGDTRCATRNCDLLPPRCTETWHAFELARTTDVLLDFCGTTDVYFYSLAQVLITGCPCQGTVTASEVGTMSCDGNGRALLFRALPAGVYYYPVVNDTLYGTPGLYQLNVRAMPTASVAPQPGDAIECLDYPALSRTGADCDRGCGNGNYVQPIGSNQSVYGRGFTYMDDGNHRQWDQDWFSFSTEDTGRVTISLISEFPASVYLFSGCDGNYIGAAQASLPGAHATFQTRVLRPGSFTLWVQPAYFMAPSDTLHYRLTVNATPCPWPVHLVPEPGDVDEGEPLCQDEYHDTYNSGCDGTEIYQPINVGDTILGTSGTYRRDHYDYRDSDYFQFQVTRPGIIHMTVISEFDVYLMLSNYCPGCDGGIAEGGGYAGQQFTISTPCVEPGIYFAAVLPYDWSMLPCSTRYRMAVTTEPCVPCPTLLVPGDLTEAEPACTTWVNHFDHFNGGCESSPPVFGPELQCGQSIWGMSGTWYGNNGRERDTDWMPFTLAEPSTPTVCVKAQFPVLTAIIGPGSGSSICDNPVLYSELGVGNACDTVCVQSATELEAGTYWLYVAPNAFFGVMCGSEYHAWLSCDACVAHTVSGLTVQRQEANIVLNWPADPGFHGTYSIYHAPRYYDWPNPGWDLLAHDVQPSGAASPETYIHTGATTAATASQYYVVVRVCP